MTNLEALFALPMILQGACMVVDEFHFHRRRGLGRWERIGHPADTFTVMLCYFIAVFFDPGAVSVKLFVAAAVFSCVFVTKDEWVHAKECDASENWLHALLFMLHPVVLAVAGVAWVVEAGLAQGGVFARLAALPVSADFLRVLLRGQLVLLCSFFVYQVVFWNVLGRGPAPRMKTS